MAVIIQIRKDKNLSCENTLIKIFITARYLDGRPRNIESIVDFQANCVSIWDFEVASTCHRSRFIKLLGWPR
jgi:hypothetical protein